MAIVGYTNAGKSTLLNTMTGATVLAEDRLLRHPRHAVPRTLRVGWAGYGEREIVVTDTVGFIRDLPKDLFAAFRATFEEAADADLLLHVVDASDPAKEAHMLTTEKVLDELDLAEIPRVLVFNKVDLLEPGEARPPAPRSGRVPDALLLAATKRDTTRSLVDRIAEELAERWERSAKGPSAITTLEIEEASAPPPDEDPQATTIDEMLRAAGKRTRGRSSTRERSS